MLSEQTNRHNNKKLCLFWHFPIHSFLLSAAAGIERVRFPDWEERNPSILNSNCAFSNPLLISTRRKGVHFHIPDAPFPPKIPRLSTLEVGRKNRYAKSVFIHWLTLLCPVDESATFQKPTYASVIQRTFGWIGFSSYQFKCKNCPIILKIRFRKIRSSGVDISYNYAVAPKCLTKGSSHFCANCQQ